MLGSSSYVTPRTVVPQRAAPSAIPTPRRETMAPADSGDGTYPYDGGPSYRTPDPSPDTPAVQPRQPTIPRDGLMVSAPRSSTPAHVYRAYTKERVTPQPTTRVVSAPAVSATKTSTIRVAYPAFGQ